MPEDIEVLRHSTAHLLAHAVKHLFPDAQVTIGPVIENGFYYDFAYQRPFTTEDLEKITEEMHRIAQQNLPIERSVVSRQEALNLFKSLKENYKVQIIQSIPENEELSLYKQGDFIDVCRGPHVKSTGEIKVFKLTKVAGAYWRGDSKNEMLQRIYGVAFFTQKELDDYLHLLEEAEKRDHRKIGRQLDLFHLQDEAPGMVFWHDKGWRIYQAIQQYMQKKLQANGYQEVSTPLILDRSLWEKSGHWDKYKELMFMTQSENREYAIKPMNCPAHVQIFNQAMRSYRELPLRLSEFGCCHRNEHSGALHGLMRIRKFTQDDAHIFCTEEQLQDEISRLIKLVYEVYSDFKFKEIEVELSTRPEKRIGSEAIWDLAEKALTDALQHQSVKFSIAKGEGAFYGPKIDFHLKDCIGRLWQCGTIQVDFSMPGRLGAEYVSEDSTKKIPVMIHRAILGSFERFIGVLIEHYMGALPVWLSPFQVVVMSITDKQKDYAEKIANELKAQGIRAKSDLRNEKIGFKIRERILEKIPYLLVVGAREAENNTVSVRLLNGDDLGSLSVEAIVQRIQAEIRNYQ